MSRCTMCHYIQPDTTGGCCYSYMLKGVVKSMHAYAWLVSSLFNSCADNWASDWKSDKGGHDSSGKTCIAQPVQHEQPDEGGICRDLRRGTLHYEALINDQRKCLED